MTNNRTIEGRAKVCEWSEHRATPGREAGVVGKSLKNDKMPIWQIVIWQIVSDKLFVGKL